MTTITLSLNKRSLSQWLEQLEFGFKTSLSQLNTQFIVKFTEQENVNLQMTQDIAELKRQVALLKRVVIILAKSSKREMGMSCGPSQSPTRKNIPIQFVEYIRQLQQAGLVDNAQKSWLHRRYIQETLRKNHRQMTLWS